LHSQTGDPPNQAAAAFPGVEGEEATGFCWFSFFLPDLRQAHQSNLAILSR